MKWIFHSVNNFFCISCLLSDQWSLTCDMNSGNKYSQNRRKELNQKCIDGRVLFKLLIRRTILPCPGYLYNLLTYYYNYLFLNLIIWTRIISKLFLLCIVMTPLLRHSIEWTLVIVASEFHKNKETHGHVCLCTIFNHLKFDIKYILFFFVMVYLFLVFKNLSVHTLFSPDKF